ncbi:MAG: type IX secretion system membrane protein PorP/SprF [Vicingaceae bacterium]
MKKLLYISFFLMAGAVYAQQVPMYSQFLFHDYLINPAIAGTKGYYDARMTQRLQWVGFDDAPRTMALSTQGPLKNRKMGIGGYFINDIGGHVYQRSGYLSYSYIAKLSGGVNMSFGLAAGISGWTLDGTKLNLNESGDQVLSNGLQSSYVPDGSFGYYIFSKRLSLGFSINQLFGSKLTFFQDGNVGTSRLKQHFNLHASYLLGSDESDFSFTPYFLLKYVNPVPAQFDVGLKAEYKKAIWLGASYRSEEAISMLLGFVLRDNLIIGYSYDFITSDVNVRANASHEIMIGLKLQRALPDKK